ncbi:DUF6381 family protein [Streptomyces sp. NPDC060027]|uniref:DUF6381 family protein n=1 Tax=Streptomyces sp. NPDC060027 TaxID=3347040 RepID=UPI003680336D
MSMTGEPGGRVQQMRAKAEEMGDLAERTSDPDERKRLSDQARRLKEQSNKETGQDPSRGSRHHGPPVAAQPLSWFRPAAAGAPETPLAATGRTPRPDISLPRVTGNKSLNRASPRSRGDCMKFGVTPIDVSVDRRKSSDLATWRIMRAEPLERLCLQPGVVDPTQEWQLLLPFSQGAQPFQTAVQMHLLVPVREASEHRGQAEEPGRCCHVGGGVMG